MALPAFGEPKVAAYPWDEWTYTDYFYHETPEMLAIYGGLTGLANRGLCIAIGEWIATRLSAAPRISEAREYFDAAWVTMIRRNCCEYAELSREEWSGPLDGVLRAAMLVVNDALFEAESDHYFAERSCWNINLARHITDDGDRQEFETWLDGATARLQAHHTGPTVGAGSIFDRDFSFGAPVGPALFILSEAYDPGQDTPEITRLANEQIGRNRYLRITSPL